MAGRKHAHGFSLLEILLVLSILGIAATVAIPALSGADPERLELATTRVAEALRHARDQARQTSQPHGVAIDHLDSDPALDELTVYRVDTAASPFAVQSVIYQPLARQPYRLTVGTAGVRIANPAAPFDFDDVSGQQIHVHFDSHGRPVLYQNGVARRLKSASLDLQLGVHSRNVSVLPYSGRVLVQ